MSGGKGERAAMVRAGDGGENAQSAGGRRSVLIEIDGGIEEVLSAEPAIRSLQEAGGGRLEVTLCTAEDGLFRNHPGVRQVVSRRAWQGGRRFDMWWRLGGEDGGDGPLVERYARRLGVELRDGRPRIYLDSFDMVRIQRFGAWRPGGMRIVIGAGAEREADAWDEGKWAELCEYLEGRLGAELIQVGARGERFFGRGCNLIGRLTARDVATVLRNSDLLIGVDNGWRHLAGAVGQKAVVLAGSAAAARLHGEGICAVAAETQGRGGASVRDIRIEEVLEGAARVQGCGSVEEMERVLCA